MKDISCFEKRKRYLVCVDSDGCAMDTMYIKHFRCFGPCMVDEWDLGEWSEEILSRWNDINLYTMTRGVNRFRGLAMILKEINEKYCRIDGIDELAYWSESSRELSNTALEVAISASPECPALKKALAWSIATNKAITELPEDEIKPFPLAKEALAAAHEVADVAIVSSANIGAVLDEWEKHGLLEHTDVVMAQNSGSKKTCIATLIERGYERENVLMCGDAPGDLDAAEKNGVGYYPILVGCEEESWRGFIDTALVRLTSGQYSGAYADAKKQEFLNNLNK